MIAKTIDEVIQQLEQIIQESKNEESPLGYFAVLYYNVTLTVKDKLNKNYFDDDARMEQLDVLFANRYLSAYYNYKEEKQITESWKFGFKSSEEKRLIVLQHLLLGMNAHINLDLGIAAAEISSESTIDELEPDFIRINEILASYVEEVQGNLAKIWPTLLKILNYLKKADDFVINFSMELARNGAWRFAKLLVGKKGFEKKELIKQRDTQISNLSKRLINYGFLAKIVVFIISISERGKPSDKIKMLEKEIKEEIVF